VRAARLVTGGVGTVEKHSILHVDHAGEQRFGQHVLAVLFLHQTQEGVVGVDQFAAMHQGQPVAESFLQRP
jgi:hypothetical protein